MQLPVKFHWWVGSEQPLFLQLWHCAMSTEGSSLTFSNTKGSLWRPFALFCLRASDPQAQPMFHRPPISESAAIGIVGSPFDGQLINIELPWWYNSSARQGHVSPGRVETLSGVGLWPGVGRCPDPVLCFQCPWHWPDHKTLKRDPARPWGQVGKIHRQYAVHGSRRGRVL